MVELVERTLDLELAEVKTWSARDRDRGHFLTPRLYPAAAVDAWQPVSGDPLSSTDDYEETYTVASESM
jgi:hypothetical protein